MVRFWSPFIDGWCCDRSAWTVTARNAAASMNRVCAGTGILRTSWWSWSAWIRLVMVTWMRRGELLGLRRLHVEMIARR